MHINGERWRGSPLVATHNNVELMIAWRRPLDQVADAVIEASTLVHEMCHVWQQTYGKPPRRGYHDRQWAAKMREIGLQPSSTGEEGGKGTGQSMSHYIVPDGRYAKAYAKLAAQGFALHWQSIPATEQARRKKSSKTKFTCPKCGQNAWAKPGALLICGECYDNGQGHICLMVAVSWGATGEPAHAGTVACRSAS